MFTSLPNSKIANGIGSPAPWLKFGGASKPKGKTLGKLRVATWNFESMTGRN